MVLWRRYLVGENNKKENSCTKECLTMIIFTHVILHIFDNFTLSLGYF